ncbi:hypothetical protein JTB14_014437 [Gonioctena quinquepunctata]|nr:hypothetical protein JTB14_014437 [Gonioctena quinquepunctata]
MKDLKGSRPCEESEESGKSTTYDGVPKLRRGTNKFVCKAGSTTKRKKLNFCIYCKALFTQLPRHLEKKHEDEQEVKQILALPKNSIERKKNLDRLRKRGNFLHNGDAFFNTGILITSRRVGVGKENTDMFLAQRVWDIIQNCLRKHFRMCDKSSGEGPFFRARKVEGDVGREANDIVRNFIFPILRDDDFTRPLRKRAGEVQRIEVEDFINHESYNNNRDQHIVDDFPEDWKKDALNFIRFTIRGKLGREVPILLYKELIVNPQTLRGTILRKDLATKSMVKGDIPVNDIADFMGHDPKIHVDHYRLPRATRDLTRVSRMLMIGNGIEVDAVGDENNTVLEDSNHSITNNADLEDVIPSISGPYNLSEDHNSMSSITKSSGKVSPKICSKRSTSPMGTVKRRSWTITEREVVFRLLKKT